MARVHVLVTEFDVRGLTRDFEYMTVSVTAMCITDAERLAEARGIEMVLNTEELVNSTRWEDAEDLEDGNFLGLDEPLSFNSSSDSSSSGLEIPFRSNLSG